MSSDTMHPRDLVGYGAHPPDPQWPNGCPHRRFRRPELRRRRRIQHHGRRRAFSDGADRHRSPVPLFGERDLNIESMFEYGSRVGFWD